MNTSDGNSILVVEDTQSHVKVLVEILGREGYRVLVAHEGESALEQARYAMPLVILLDVMMPGMDGFEVCRRLKAASPTAGIPVIFMSALADLEDKVKGFEAGGADYVVKPFEHREVLARVRTHAGTRQLQLQLAQANADLESKVAAQTADLRAALQEVERLKQRLQDENAPAAAAVYSLEQIERQHFIAVLKKTRGVIEGPHGAARLLDLKPSTARFRIKKLGIRREELGL